MSWLGATLPVLALAGTAGEFTCGVPWPDFCNGTSQRHLTELRSALEGRGESHGAASPHRGCTPYNPPLPPGTDWAAVRRELVDVLFGSQGGVLPQRKRPDQVAPLRHEQVFGNCVCASRGVCSPEDCSRQTNLTKLVWTLEIPVNASFTLRLNATGFHSLNTSGIAPDNEPGTKGVVWPADPLPATSFGQTLVIFHSGHVTSTDCDPDHDGTVDWLNRLGYDTMHLQMPLCQCNSVEGIRACDHGWFEQFEVQGAAVFRAFLEPVVLAVNYAREVLGYRWVVMAGLSGGGWTTTLAAAIDPRIVLSLPVAGSIPCDFHHTSWDFEQFCDNKWALTANYTSLYALGALEAGRSSLQMIHEADPCCFHACHRKERILTHSSWVQSQVAGQFATAVTSGNVHEVNDRDKVIIAVLVEKLSRVGNLTAADFAQLPFNILGMPELDGARRPENLLAV